MARDTQSIVKMSRREGYALHRKAHKIMAKRGTVPGQHGATVRRNQKQFNIQLREKQKVKRLYGLLEKQFRRLYEEASKKQGASGATLLEYLERRLDNVIYRAGFANSRRAARQLATHGHFVLNGVRVDIPSIRVKAGDIIELRPKSTKSSYFTKIDEHSPANNESYSWLTADRKKFTIKVTGNPARTEAEPDLNEQLIVEYYSR